MLLSRSAETWEHPGCVTKLLWPLSPRLGQHCLNRDYHTTVDIKGTPPPPHRSKPLQIQSYDYINSLGTVIWHCVIMRKYLKPDKSEARAVLALRM